MQPVADAPFDPGFRILSCCSWRLARWEFTAVGAPYWRIYHNRDAGARVESGRQRVDLVPGEIVIIPPDTPFKAAQAGVVRHLFLHVSVRGALRPGAGRVFHGAPDAATRRLCADLEGLLPLVEARGTFEHEGPVPRRLRLAAVAFAGSALRMVPDEVFRARSGESRVDAALAIMERRLQDPPSCAELAAGVGMHRVSFARLFRAVTGDTPKRHGVRVRIAEACVLLHHTDLGIDEIAERTGFCDRFHFSKAFVRERATGPAAFRASRFR